MGTIFLNFSSPACAGNPMIPIPTIHGIPAPNFCGSMNQGGSGGPGQPFVFAEDFEDMELGSGQGDLVAPHSIFPSQLMSATPTRFSRDPRVLSSSPRRPNPDSSFTSTNYRQH